MPPRGTHGANAARARRRTVQVAHEEEGGSERWLVTYADMLTLLLVLFIVLFSISVVNTSKYISLKTSLAAVFGDGTKGMLSGGSGLNENDAQGTGQQLVMPGTPVSPVVQQKDGKSQDAPSAPSAVMPTGYTQHDVKNEVQSYRRITQAIHSSLAAHHMQGDVQFKITARGLVITVVTSALIFPGNSATLLPDGQRLLSVIGPPLADQPRKIEVDGYTNQLHVSTGPYPSGWELSSARASAVVRSLIGYGVEESRLSAVGYSDQHPLYPASDPRSVTRNRRVEIVALNNLPSSAGSDLVAEAARHNSKEHTP
jgi:chemotaxis protein MotB